MAYNVEYFFEYYDIGGTVKHEVELFLKDYSGGATRIEKADVFPVHMRYVGDQTRFEETIIQGLELVFSFQIPRADADTFDSIFESDYKDYKLRYTVDNVVEFEGYIKPENLIKQYSKNPPFMRITLSATDALADLKGVDFLDSGGLPINDTLTILRILKYALDPIGFELQIQVQLGTYESVRMASNECALKEVQLDTRRFFKEEAGKMEYMSCWHVIEAVLKDYNVTLKQNKGKYQITCPYELDSYQFLYDWATLTQQSRSSNDMRVDISTYDFDPVINQQKIRPLKAVGITHQNRDLGGPITGFDLTDWAGVWTIDFYNTNVTNNIITLTSKSSETPSIDDNSLTLTSTFSVSRVTGNDYLKVTFDHLLSSYLGSDTPHVSIKIEITRPDSSTSPATYRSCYDQWTSFDSPMTNTFKVVATGEYNITITFIPNEAFSWIWDDVNPIIFFKLKDVRISKVVNVLEEEDVSAVVFDRYFYQASGKGFEVFKSVTLLADAGQITEVGAFLYVDSAEYVTAVWRTYGHTEDIALLDIYASRILDNRYDYKNLLKRIIIYDRDSNIDFNTVLTIQSRNYVFLSYDRNFENGSIRADVMEILTTQQSYGLIEEQALTSVDGVKINIT
ncbi:MAG TPA: hypothetical protein ENH82_14405, partial [bacterium]|nr:hypothetical protein [bacterium]